jgi:hypothetical protein
VAVAQSLVASPSPGTKERSKAQGQSYPKAGLSDSLVKQLAKDVVDCHLPYNQVTVGDIIKFQKQRSTGQDTEEVYGTTYSELREKFKWKLRQWKSFSPEEWNSLLYQLNIHQDLPSAPQPQGPSCEPLVILLDDEDDNNISSSLNSPEFDTDISADKYIDRHDDHSHTSQSLSASISESILCEEISNMSISSKSKHSVTFDSGSLALARKMIPDGCQLSKFHA